jgi:hypothetical protein
VNHRGLHWAWPHIKIDEREVDLWSLRDVRHEFQRWITKETNSNGAVLGVENGWFVGNKRVMLEQVRATVYPASPQGRFIDLELTLTPEVRPISLWGAEGKSYGGLTLRFSPRSKTIVTVPSGRSREDLLITRLPWADLSGDLAGNNDLSGAAVFVHPKHPDYPPTWMTREYGLLAVGWPGITPQSLPAGKPVLLSYRIWIHRGVPVASEIQKASTLINRSRTDSQFAVLSASSVELRIKQSGFSPRNTIGLGNGSCPILRGLTAISCLLVPARRLDLGFNLTGRCNHGKPNQKELPALKQPAKERNCFNLKAEKSPGERLDGFPSLTLTSTA